MRALLSRSLRRKRLRKLVKTAQRGADPADLPAALPGVPTDEGSVRLADLERLRAWYVEWSEPARAVIKRRDYLIRLGLARRKVSKKQAKGKGEEPKPGGDAAGGVVP